MSKVVHFEVPVDDPQRASAFYTNVFGWDIAAWGEEGYWLATTGREEEPGIEGALITRSEMHPSPVIVVGVESIDVCLEAAQQSGADILMGKQTIPSVGYSAYLRDTEGNVIGLFEPTPA